MDIKSVLLTVPFPQNYLENIIEVLKPSQVHVVSSNDTAAIGKALETADIALLSGDITEQILTGKNLKWIHCDHSGLTHSAKKEIFERGIAVTGSAGRSAPTLAEHAILFMLSLTYDMHALHDLQKAHVWGGLPGYNDRRGLIGKTAGIIGLGHTGKELAKRLKAFDMKVLGYRRSSEPVENVDVQYSKDNGDSNEALLKESDYLILTTQLSDETYHLIGEKELQTMKKSAYIINMCRGSVIDEKALIEALEKDVIAGAGLDTTEIEPLPKQSKLWDTKNVILTPHNTPTVPDRWGRSFEIISDNIRRYRENKPLRNQITLRDVYTHGKPSL